ncbi:amidase [Phenylobacterium sp. LjRoot225]|uniref:amidase n=1 Tax=Phenylobacterium sp. LjRoot225 TaxID=3342285 RepID=UPI003ECE8E8A
MGELAWTPAWRLREMIGRKELSPVELMTDLLARIDRLQPEIHPFVTIDAVGALAGARAAEQMVMRGEPLGPLHGLPVSIKDLLITKGLRTTAGSRLFENFIPDVDTVPSERLKQAGAIVFAKTNTPEFGLNRRSINLVADETLCPWDLERSSGGSSGGSGSAVAAGLGAISIGTDGGGSTRLPSAFNGLVGLQPSRGRIPVGPRLFDLVIEGIGPMTRDVRDAALTLQVLAGYDAREPFSLQTTPPDYLGTLDDGVGSLRVAWSRDFGFIKPHDDEVVDTIHRTAQLLGRQAAAYSEPDIKLQDAHDALDRDPEFTLTKAEAAYAGVEGFKPIARFLSNMARNEPDNWSKLAVYIRDRADRPTELEYAMSIPPAVRQRPAAKLASVFETCDLLLSPTTSRTAFLCTETGITPWLYTQYTMLANLAGYCAINVPAGVVRGLPVGLHIMARPDQEHLLLRAARVLEQLQPWAQHKPQLAL